ncbi:ABC transporter ATP-binding protein [Sulfitobacter mediterraneus]|uniref:energy-coupling factor ABC transporter ATP-binding protein n=1 Tax=Sulfitobacter mediterraneus TaxID=83219 RepID=UPI001934ACFD|nr:ABC transporter ATP-binding protein [Sulfitobacter mediterraneus]MBM1633306.1 ABC transporter ATP-binding protein [Sulfitobacter mediterraneus]MBM1640560.1 ABC transporter ATP-binding protein [Sulfitobacter mediterraneus]MBM1645171.1 ABC transporter ATP-binding protein [Sulfitobacter mediterraneus]MBM1648680.1 ABC transporter ATP-binding protein [Sulfitobacter mediterraneus]MBM1652701.1 ABC transporter ATP-binding protein [Sulfitobacter mediterraneus]
MTDPNAHLIDMQAIGFAPEGKPVLSDIDLRSNARRIGVVGRNGSGKTTLARIMAGLIAPDAGQVRIAGINVAKDRKAALGVIGILFQNPDHQIIFPTVEEELAFGLLQQGHPKSEAARAVAQTLADFGKSHWAKAAIHQLSQGQRQLVCLMSVLAMRPKVIILDEPFAGLDIPTTLHLQRTLEAIDLTLVHITHDPAVLVGYDEVLWVDQGKTELIGAAAQVLPAFQDRMTQIGAGDDLSDLTS